MSAYYQPYCYNRYAGYTEIIGYDKDFETFELGTLLLRMVDRKTRNVVRKGTATNFIGGQKDLNDIADFLDDLFENFPTNGK